MKSICHSVALLLAINALVAGCRTPRQNINYLHDTRDSTHNYVWQNYETKIQPGDRLSIYVTALNPESAKPYIMGSGGGTSAGASSGTPSILVDNQGRILYPQLGFIQVAGLSLNSLRDTLLQRLSTYLTDPVVTVDFANFKITVLGEVARQGQVQVQDGHMTILEAIGQAGDISVTGERDIVLVIRETNGKREFGHINMYSNEIFKSP